MNFLRSKFALAVIVLSGFAFAAVSSQTANAAFIQDCSENSIVKCGASTPTSLINKIKADEPGDLKALFGGFGITSDKYPLFINQAKMGTVYKDGRVVVDGKVVATDAYSLGRNPKSYSTPYKVAGKTYHVSSTKDVFNRDSLDAFVLFNNDGQPGAIILTACGNPVGGKLVKPGYKCDQLVKEEVKNKKNTYNFSTEAPVTSGATVSKVVYDFGDGSKVTKTNPKEKVPHTYTKPGTYTTKVTVYVKLPGGNEVAVNGSGCATQITVKEEKPPVKKIAAWQCTGLTATPQVEADSSFAYTLRANASMTNARLIKADFDFGDGSTMNGVTPVDATSNTVSTNHTYAEAKSYTAKATLYFEATNGADAQGKATSVTCQATFAITKPAVLSSVTTPPPAELPKTGAAGLVGLFGGASVLGTLGYRWQASRKLRQRRVDDLIDSLQR
jgi:hypothetical protein